MEHYFDTYQKIKQLLFLSIIMFHNIFLFSQSNTWDDEIIYEEDIYSKFITYQTQDGLSSNSTYDIFQDRYGYIWVGTADGLNKFDGYEFEIFQTSINDPNSISNNCITGITEDYFGNLWISTENGLNRYRRKSNDFIRYTTNSNTEFNLIENHIVSIASDDSLLFFDSYSGFFHVFNQKNRQLSFFNHSGNRTNNYKTQKIIIEDSLVWITNNYNLSLYNKLNNELLLISSITSNDTLRTCNTTTFTDKNNNRYFGFTNDCLMQFDCKKNKLSYSKTFASLYNHFFDREGNVWLVGYSLGAMKYNLETKKLILYKHNKNSLTSIANNLIYSVIEDASGNIWFATANGISMLPKKSAFTHLQNIPDCNKSLISNDIRQIIQDKDKLIWIASFEGIQKISQDLKESSYLKHNPQNSNSLLSDRVNTLYEGLDGNIYIGYWAGLGFSIFNTPQNIFNHYKFGYGDNVNGYDWYVGFTEDNIGNLYTAMWGGIGLTTFDLQKKDFTSSHFNNFHYVTSTKKIKVFNDYILFSYFIYSKKNGYRIISYKTGSFLHNYYAPYLNNKYFKLNTTQFNIKNSSFNNYSTIDSILYICTSYGVILFDEENETFKEFITIDEDVYNITPSTEKNCYILGTINGVKFYNENSKQLINFENINKIQTEKVNDIIEYNNYYYLATKTGIYRLQVDNDEKKYLLQKIDLNEKTDEIFKLELIDDAIFAASDNGLVKIKDGKFDKIYNYNNSNLKSFLINDLFLDKNKILWLSTPFGLYYFNPQNNEFNVLLHDPLNPNTISNDNTCDLDGNGNGKLYVCHNNALCIVDVDSKNVQRLDEVHKYSIQNSLVNCINKDNLGNIWVGQDYGINTVNLIDPVTKIVRHFIDRPYDKNSYKGNITNCIYQDSKNTIWIGSDKGLNKYNKLSDDFILYTKEDGLISNNIKSIEEGKNGALWISTDKGISRFNPTNGDCKNYNNIQGLPILDYGENSSQKLANDFIMFGSANGICYFHPDSVDLSKKNSRIAFTKLWVNDKISIPDLSKTKNIELNHHQNNFYIEFTNLDFIRNQYIQYAYKLENYDKDWIYTNSKKRIAKYTNLKYGDYTLLLKSTNYDGVWSKAINIEIKIIAPWYKTIWAYISYFLLLAFIIIVILKLRTRNLVRKSNKLEEQINKKANEIAETKEELLRVQTDKKMNELKLSSIKTNIETQENLRMKIASTLHDEVGGNLTGVKLLLNSIIKKNDSEELRILQKDIDISYEKIRNISHDLISPEFNEMHICQILEDHISKINKRVNKNINFIFHPKTGWIDVDENIQTEIYRTSQELLTNSLKHSRAKNITFQLLMHKSYINLISEDDGIGFLPNNNKGKGLLAIRNRIDKMGGTIDIDSSNNGSTISVILPIII